MDVESNREQGKCACVLKGSGVRLVHFGCGAMPPWVLGRLSALNPACIAGC